MKTTKEKCDWLRSENGRAGHTAFHRIRIAYEVYKDEEWVAAQGGADKARDYIASEFLSDLTVCDLDPHDLFVLLDEFPNEQTWRGEGYSLRAMWAHYMIARKERKQEDAERAPRRTATVKQVEELNAQIATLQETNAKLQDDNDRLRSENTQLHGRIARLEGMVEVLKDRQPELALAG